jgi:hypothetical protein
MNLSIYSSLLEAAGTPTIPVSTNWASISCANAPTSDWTSRRSSSSVGVLGCRCLILSATRLWTTSTNSSKKADDQDDRTQLPQQSHVLLNLPHKLTAFGIRSQRKRNRFVGHVRAPVYIKVQSLNVVFAPRSRKKQAPSSGGAGPTEVGEAQA